MKIDGIENGVVIDHIKAGTSMKIYNFLELDTVDEKIALIKNVSSKRRGKKDIIKIENGLDLNFDILGYIDPDITVNIIKDGKLVEKKTVLTPKEVVNIIKCNNPRCITSVENNIDHIFKLQDNGTYRCVYCESTYKN